MKLGLFGGGFKPFTTGHFAKLASAIEDHQGPGDMVYLFYGLQKRAPIKIGKKGQPLKSHQKFRSIGSSKRFYTPELSKEIFDIYEEAIERELPNVEVESTIGSTPMRRIFEIVEQFSENPEMYEKVTIYGGADTIREYIRKISYFGDMLESGKVQLGSIPPESINDYLDEERLIELIERSEESALAALRPHYPEADDQDLERMQKIRGTEVRDIASTEAGIEQAKRYLPPFLNDSEKDDIIQILLAGEQQSPQDNSLSEVYLRAFIRGFIRG